MISKTTMRFQIRELYQALFQTMKMCLNCITMQGNITTQGSVNFRYHILIQQKPVAKAGKMDKGVWIRFEDNGDPIQVELAKEKTISILIQESIRRSNRHLDPTKCGIKFNERIFKVGEHVFDIPSNSSENPVVIYFKSKNNLLIFRKQLSV